MWAILPGQWEICRGKFGTSRQSVAQMLDYGLAVCSKFALPDDEDLPSEFAQLLLLPIIAPHVRLELAHPEFHPSAGNTGEPATGMSMPEASVNEDDDRFRREHKVGTPGQIAASQDIAKPPRMEASSHQQFGLRVPATDALHHAATGRRIDDVGHAASRAACSGGRWTPTARSG